MLSGGGGGGGGVHSRFSSARARYTAAVWAAGPEPMMTTLLCMLRFPRVCNSLGDGAFVLEIVAAAATESPVMPERRLRLKYEENSLAA